MITYALDSLEVIAPCDSRMWFKIERSLEQALELFEQIKTIIDSKSQEEHLFQVVIQNPLQFGLSGLLDFPTSGVKTYEATGRVSF